MNVRTVLMFFTFTFLSDPVFILQTAQELLALACHRVQVLKEEGSTGPGATPPSPGEF